MSEKQFKEMVNNWAWNSCQCGDHNCLTVWKECHCGLVSIIPSKHFNSFTVKGQSGTDKVQIIPVGSLMQAVKAAEDLAREYKGWL